MFQWLIPPPNPRSPSLPSFYFLRTVLLVTAKSFWRILTRQCLGLVLMSWGKLCRWKDTEVLGTVTKEEREGEFACIGREMKECRKRQKRKVFPGERVQRKRCFAGLPLWSLSAGFDSVTSTWPADETRRSAVALWAKVLKVEWDRILFLHITNGLEDV